MTPVLEQLVERSRPSIATDAAACLEASGRPAPPPLSAEAALRALVAAVQDLAEADSVQKVQRIVLRAARRLTGATGATFVLREGESCLVTDTSASLTLWRRRRALFEKCAEGGSILSRRPLVVEDTLTDPQVASFGYEGTFVRSLLVTPIRTLEPLGAIGLYWPEPRSFGELEMALAKALADSTAVALENVTRRDRLADARRLAGTDPLTGIANRRRWEAALAASLQDGESELHVVLIDLDHFKRYNDTFGHPAGDRLLREAAEAWSHTLRDHDLVARIGGEEFGVLLAGCSASGAFSAAERLRTATPTDTTASVGIATWDGTESAEELITRADRALYAAKAAGRNQTVWAA